MLLRIFNDLRPTHIAVCFDRPLPTFRKKLYKGYQAKRPKMDEELAGQIEKVHEVVRAFGLPIFEKDGFEADDIIGTLCRIAISDKKKVKSKTQNVSLITSHLSLPIDQVIIVSGDKDLLQLVDDHTYAYMPTKGLSEAKLYREKDVVERMGVVPMLIPDLKGLMGDSSDNYPGVEGIGPKTAASLLHVFGTVEKIYTALQGHDKKMDAFSASVIDKLVKGKESAEMSKDLATIRTNVELDETLGRAYVTTLDTPDARKILGDLHFHSLLKRLTGEKNVEIHEKIEKAKEDISSQQELF
jgi:DNA polymerase-1